MSSERWTLWDWGSLFAFCFCFAFACHGFGASSVSRLPWGVWELFSGDTGNTSLCILAIGLTQNMKHFINHFRQIWKQFFERQFLGALTLTVPCCWFWSPQVHWVLSCWAPGSAEPPPANIHYPAVRGAVWAVDLYIQLQQYTEKGFGGKHERWEVPNVPRVHCCLRTANSRYQTAPRKICVSERSGDFKNNSFLLLQFSAHLYSVISSPVYTW